MPVLDQQISKEAAQTEKSIETSDEEKLQPPPRIERTNSQVPQRKQIPIDPTFAERLTQLEERVLAVEDIPGTIVTTFEEADLDNPPSYQDLFELFYSAKDLVKLLDTYSIVSQRWIQLLRVRFQGFRSREREMHGAVTINFGGDGLLKRSR